MWFYKIFHIVLTFLSFDFVISLPFVPSVSFTSLDFPQLQPRINGGSDVVEKQNFPWMVSIVYYGSHHCGGSIINSKTILTAAHCLLYINLRFVKVRVGTKFRSFCGKLLQIHSTKTHENFNLGNMDYDIGIVRLHDELIFDETIKPIKLQNSNDIVNDGVKAVVTGWGVLDVKTGVYPEILQYLQIEVMNNIKCNNLMKNLITDRMLCAGYLYGGHDACNQDSGGPLVTNFTQIGIVSWGDGCGKVNRLGVYTNISSLRTWIEDTLFIEYNDKLPTDFDSYVY